MSDDSLIFDDDEGNESPFSPEPVVSFLCLGHSVLRGKLITVQKKKPTAKKGAAPKKPAAVKKATTAKPLKPALKKRTFISDDDSDGGDLASTPPPKKQRKLPVKKAASKAKPLQAKENESEMDGEDDAFFEDAAEVPGAEGKKSSGDAYQKVYL